MPDSELYHHGIKGQKWGIRRFQNKDGAGKKKAKHYNKIDRESDEKLYGKQGTKRIEKRMSKGQSHTRAQIVEIGHQTVVSMLASTVALDVATKGTLHTALANMAVSKLKSYASEKAVQRTNASLAKIGTMTLQHVAGDVYETVMK